MASLNAERAAAILHMEEVPEAIRRQWSASDKRNFYPVGKSMRQLQQDMKDVFY